MKSQKLIVIAAIVCLLVGASGAAMAVENCAGGLLVGIILEDVVIDGSDCLIQDAAVFGDIRVSNSEDITIVSSEASGVILIQDSGVVAVIASSARNIRVRRNDLVLVVGSIAKRNLVVNRNDFAGVKQNGALLSIICRGNIELDARFNNTEGVEECPR
jgi:hypothetical protein